MTRTTNRRNAKGHTKRMRKSLAAWVRKQIGAGKKKNPPLEVYTSGISTKSAAQPYLRKARRDGWTNLIIRKGLNQLWLVLGFKPGKQNPVRRVAAKGTGWVKAKAVRIVRQKGHTVVQVKR